MQSNTIVFRADKAMLDKIRLDAKRHQCSNSHVIRDALSMYYEPDTSTINQGYTAHLEHEIEFLRGQCNALLISNRPLLQRVIARLRG